MRIFINHLLNIQPTFKNALRVLLLHTSERKLKVIAPDPLMHRALNGMTISKSSMQPRPCRSKVLKFHKNKQVLCHAANKANAIKESAAWREETQMHCTHTHIQTNRQKCELATEFSDSFVRVFMIVLLLLIIRFYK